MHKLAALQSDSHEQMVRPTPSASPSLERLAVAAEFGFGRITEVSVNNRMDAMASPNANTDRVCLHADSRELRAFRPQAETKVYV